MFWLLCHKYWEEKIPVCFSCNHFLGKPFYFMWGSPNSIAFSSFKWNNFVIFISVQLRTGLIVLLRNGKFAFQMRIYNGFEFYISNFAATLLRHFLKSFIWLEITVALGLSQEAVPSSPPTPGLHWPDTPLVYKFYFQKHKNVWQRRPGNLIRSKHLSLWL